MSEKRNDSLIGISVVSIILMFLIYLDNARTLYFCLSFLTSAFKWLMTLVISSIIQWVVGAVVLVVLAVVVKRYFTKEKNNEFEN